MSARAWLAVALLALALLFGAWFWREGATATLWVFILPPLALAALLRRRPRAASFWAGVLALAWFSHGIMAAWSRPGERGYALVEVALALLVILAANFPALQARFGRHRADPNV